MFLSPAYSPWKPNFTNGRMVSSKPASKRLSHLFAVSVEEPMADKVVVVSTFPSNAGFPVEVMELLIFPEYGLRWRQYMA